MTVSVDRMTLACIRDGIAVADLPRSMQRAVSRLVVSGDLAVSVATRPAGAGPEPVTVADSTPVAPLTAAERARIYRQKRKSATDERNGAVTEERDASRDGVGPTVTPGVTLSVTASRDASRVLSLSPPQDLGSLFPDSEAEGLGDQVGSAGARDAGVGEAVTVPLFERDVTRDALCRQARRMYATRYEQQWKDLCPPMAAEDDHVRRVVAWAMGTADPAAALERFIDGAFTPAKWRKPTCRSPWRFIAEDPGATAAYSTRPSPTAHDAKRPPLPRQELPPDPAEAGGAF